MMDDALPQSDQLSAAKHPRETYTLFGQAQAENQFLDAYTSGRLHHALLLSGPKGVGKATLAWRIARFVLGQGGDKAIENLDISPEDPISRRIEALGEPRLNLIRRAYDQDKKKIKTQITVDEIRALKNFFQMSAADGGWRVAIIDAADDLNKSAANALLKLLEEPPEKCLFLLVAHQPAKVLPTIRSRCAQISLRKLEADILAEALTHQGRTLGFDANYLTELADGSLGSAIELLEQDGLAIYAKVAKIFADIPKMDRSDVVNLANECAGAGREAHYDMVLRLIFLYLSRLAKFGAVQPSSFQEAAPEEGRHFARLAPHSKSAQKWASLISELTTKVDYARTVNLDPASVILDMFLEINKTAAN
ncbi:MAG: DNA polymerase III subunit delta' [Pseudomonadota bacterium]